QGLRQFRVWLVMVGDDQVETEVPRSCGRLDTANAAVHRDDQHDAEGMKTLDRRRLQAITVSQPLGDEVRNVRAEQLQCATENDRGGDTVHVVVAVDRDALLVLDRAKDAVDSRW